MRLVGAVLGTVLVTSCVQGCCVGRVSSVPLQDGTIRVTSLSRAEDCSVNKAQEHAQKDCESRGLRVVVVDTKTVYQGADKTAKAALAIATGFDASNSNDYKTTVEYRCL